MKPRYQNRFLGLLVRITADCAGADAGAVLVLVLVSVLVLVLLLVLVLMMNVGVVGGPVVFLC